MVVVLFGDWRKKDNLYRLFRSLSCLCRALGRGYEYFYAGNNADFLRRRSRICAGGGCRNYCRYVGIEGAWKSLGTILSRPSLRTTPLPHYRRSTRPRIWMAKHTMVSRNLRRPNRHPYHLRPPRDSAHQEGIHPPNHQHHLRKASPHRQPHPHQHPPIRTKENKILLRALPPHLH